MPCRVFEHPAVHFLQGFNGAIVNIAPVNEGAEFAHEGFTLLDIPRHRPRLDQRITLPVATLALVVLFHRAEAASQWPGLAKRPQACVDPEAKAVFSNIRKTSDDGPDQPDKKFPVTQLAPTVTFSGSRKAENQVDVGRQVELSTTELAQAKHHQLLFFATLIAGHAVAPDQGIHVGVHSTAQRHFGQAAEVTHGLFQRCKPIQFTPDDPHHLKVAEPSQARIQAMLRNRHLQMVSLWRADAIQSAGVFEGREPVGMTPNQAIQERAAFSRDIQHRKSIKK